MENKPNKTLSTGQYRAAALAKQREREKKKAQLKAKLPQAKQDYEARRMAVREQEKMARSGFTAPDAKPDYTAAKAIIQKSVQQPNQTPVPTQLEGSYIQAPNARTAHSLMKSSGFDPRHAPQVPMVQGKPFEFDLKDRSAFDKAEASAENVVQTLSNSRTLSRGQTPSPLDLESQTQLEGAQNTLGQKGTYQSPLATTLRGVDRFQSLDGQDVFRKRNLIDGKQVTEFSDRANINTLFGGRADPIPEGTRAVAGNDGGFDLDRVQALGQTGQSRTLSSASGPQVTGYQSENNAMSPHTLRNTMRGFGANIGNGKGLEYLDEMAKGLAAAPVGSKQLEDARAEIIKRVRERGGNDAYIANFDKMHARYSGAIENRRSSIDERNNAARDQFNKDRDHQFKVDKENRRIAEYGDTRAREDAEIQRNLDQQNTTNNRAARQEFDTNIKNIDQHIRDRFTSYDDRESKEVTDSNQVELYKQINRKDIGTGNVNRDMMDLRYDILSEAMKSAREETNFLEGWLYGKPGFPAYSQESADEFISKLNFALKDKQNGSMVFGAQEFDTEELDTLRKNKKLMTFIDEFAKSASNRGNQSLR